MISSLLLAAAAACAPVAPAPLAGDYLELAPAAVEMLRDPDGTLTLDEVAAAPACARFASAPGYPRFGTRRGGVWLRFAVSLPPQPVGGWKLLVSFAELDRVCMHWPVAGGGYASSCSGTESPDAVQAWGGGYLFAIPGNHDPARPAYVHAHSATLLKVPLTIGSTGALLREHYRAQFGLGLYYGVLLSAVLLALSTWAGLRQAAVLHYAVHIGSYALALAAWSGRLLEWGLPAWVSDRSLPGLGALFIYFGTLFYVRLLETRRHAPRTHRVLHAAGIAAAVPFLAGMVDPWIGNRLLAVVALPWLGAIVTATVIRVRHGYTPALWALLAMGLVLATVLLKAMEVLGWPLVSPDIANMLSFALALNMRWLAQQRDRAARLAATHQEAALYRSRFDEVTRLPNRDKFRDDLGERLARSDGQTLAVIMLGLDHFRELNHVLGHDAGDSALHELAHRLRGALTGDVLLARMAADTFGIVVALPGGGSLVEHIADRCLELQHLVQEPLSVGGGIKLSATLGVAAYPTHGLTADELLRHSDVALYRAREVGGGALEVYRPEFLRVASEHLTVGRDLRQALARGEVALYYQPILSLADGKLHGVEALLRWNRPDGSVIPPDVFVPIAEASGLISELSDWVLARACAQLAEWRIRGVPVPRMAVNLSAKLFAAGTLAGRIRDALAAAHLPGEAFEVEITENALVENIEGANAALRELRRMQVGVAMDDFGVGYSSLHYLRSLPLTALKIDRSFLRGVPDELEGASVIAAMIAMGHELRLNVVAEGIETQAQFDWLRAHGVRYGQGFLFSRALPADDFERWLDTHEAERRWAA
jgi:diguanylate cyclase